MTKPWLTDGNLDRALAYQEEIRAHLHNAAKETGQLDKSEKHIKELQSAIGPYAQLRALNITKPIPPKAFRKNKKGEPEDKTPFAEPSSFSGYIAALVAASFGRGGGGSVATVAEALLVVNCLARGHQAEKIYYRGEHRYGYSLRSRAQRTMEDETGGPLESENGITKRELDELKRFQKEVKADSDFLNEITQGQELPDDDDPEWLPIMQHYDQSFGTRLLDITRSIFAGLHFACIGWDGTIDFDTDGLLYIFFGHGRYYTYEPLRGFADDISEFVPSKVTDAFKNWQCPEYIHHFNSKQSSMRELAQDGQFLVLGDLSRAPVFGGNGQFKLCIPRWAKAQIIEELWFTGFTPERIVRGKMGQDAAEKSKEQLAAYRALIPAWDSP